VGGADRVIRCWEPTWPERSYAVAGPVWPDGIIEPESNMLQPPATQRRYRGRMVEGAAVLEEVTLLGEAGRQVQEGWRGKRCRRTGGHHCCGRARPVSLGARWASPMVLDCHIANY
jgi:hypothetical protein